MLLESAPSVSLPELEIEFQGAVNYDPGDGLTALSICQKTYAFFV